MDAGARVNHEPLRGDERLGRALHVGRIGAAARCVDRLVVERFRNFGVVEVIRNLDDDRTMASVTQQRERAPQDVRHFGTRGDRFGVLGNVRHHDRSIEIIRHVRDTRRVAAGQDQQRNRFGVRLRNRTVRVLDARAVLTREHADLLAARKPCDGVGHVYRDSLLAHDDRADVVFRSGLDDGVARIGEQDLHAFAFEDFGDRRGRFHDKRSLFRPGVRSWVRRAGLRGVGEEKLEIVFGERFRDRAVGFDDRTRERALALGERANLFFNRTGGHHPVRRDRTRLPDAMRAVDVRVLAATHRDLEEAMT